MTNCWFCGNEMIWGGDASYEDYGIEGEGIVANMSCSNPACNTSAEFYHTIEKKNVLFEKED